MSVDTRPRGGPPAVRPPARPQPTRRPKPEPAVRPDPRIAARRIAVKRDAGRRRLRRLAVVGAVAAVVAAAVLATRSPLLDVDRVEVRGAERIAVGDVREVAATAGAAPGEPLTSVDEAAVERALEALPDVAAAEVRRDWPGTVAVEVTERLPIAAVAAGNRTAVVAADGVVVEVVATPPSTLPLLEGADADAEPGAVVDEDDLLDVAAALPPALAGRVESIAKAGKDVELHLADGHVARLGPTDGLPDKLVAVLTVLDQVDLPCGATIDVRVPSAPAVTDGCGP